MDKLRLIIAREYKSIVGRKSFIILTLLLPFLIILIGSVPALIAYLNDGSSINSFGAGGDSAELIAVVDHTGKYASVLENDNQYNFHAEDTALSVRELYDQGVYMAIVEIPKDVETSAQVNIYSEGTIPPVLVTAVDNTLTDTIQKARLAASGITNLQKIIEENQVNLSVRNVTLQKDGNEKESSTDAAMALGLMLAFLIYMFVIFYGQMIMNSVVEEKTNRIVEVVVSSCRPFHLMLGKIIGVGLAGLTQMGIWIVLLGITYAVAANVLGFAGAAMNPDVAGSGVSPDMVDGAMRQVLSINYLSIIFNFLLYFIGGYLLYSAIYAALGSAVDQASDASQLLWPVMIIIVIAIYAAMGCMNNPNGPMAFWCSIIPFTSPIVMMIRLPYDVPFWQLLLSYVLLYATAFAIVWVAARIYRRGIFHYGQKASFKDLFKWIK